MGSRLDFGKANGCRHLVFVGGDRLSTLDESQLQAQEVVAELELAVLGVEAPAIGAAALAGQSAHAMEQELGVAADELRPAGEIGVEALHSAVVERKDG
jgi:hypothetical protein